MRIPQCCRLLMVRPFGFGRVWDLRMFLGCEGVSCWGASRWRRFPFFRALWAVVEWIFFVWLWLFWDVFYNGRRNGSHHWWFSSFGWSISLHSLVLHPRFLIGTTACASFYSDALGYNTSIDQRAFVPTWLFESTDSFDLRGHPTKLFHQYTVITLRRPTILPKSTCSTALYSAP